VFKYWFDGLSEFSMPRCKSKTSQGKPCRNNAIPGTDYCYLKSHSASIATISERIKNYLLNHILSIIALALTVTALVFYFHDKKINATSGLIEADGIAKRKYIALGGALFSIDSPDNVFLRDGVKPQISLRVENQKLFVSSTVRDGNGEIIAELRDNEWDLNEGFYVDRNYTDQILEVRANSGDVILQVENFGEVIRIAGVFNCKNGHRFALAPFGKFGAMIVPEYQENQLDGIIDPICDYPSNLHLGSCLSSNAPKKLNQVDGRGSYILDKSLDLCTAAREGEI